MANNQRGKSWTSEAQFIAVLSRMTVEERASFLLRYAAAWRGAVISGKLTGRTGGEMLRESLGLPVKKRRRGKT